MCFDQQLRSYLPRSEFHDSVCRKSESAFGSICIRESSDCRWLFSPIKMSYLQSNGSVTLQLTRIFPSRTCSYCMKLWSGFLSGCMAQEIENCHEQSKESTSASAHEPHFCLAQRAAMAFRAISRRRFGESFAARALPPFEAPSFESATAAGFFFRLTG